MILLRLFITPFSLVSKCVIDGNVTTNLMTTNFDKTNGVFILTITKNFLFHQSCFAYNLSSNSLFCDLCHFVSPSELVDECNYTLFGISVNYFLRYSLIFLSPP